MKILDLIYDFMNVSYRLIHPPTSLKVFQVLDGGALLHNFGANEKCDIIEPVPEIGARHRDWTLLKVPEYYFSQHCGL